VPRAFHFEYILPAWKYEFERERKVFFFEKKKQKTFVCFGFGFAGDRLHPNEQKFFYHDSLRSRQSVRVPPCGAVQLGFFICSCVAAAS
jgi:hypothetical protein